MINKKDWETIRPWTILALICFALLVVLMKFDNIVSFVRMFLALLKPLFYGIVIAFVLNVPMKLIEKNLIKYFPKLEGKGYLRLISILLSLILVIVIISTVIGLLAPQLYSTISQLLVSLPSYIDNIETMLNQIFEALKIDYKVSFDTILAIPLNEIINAVSVYFNTYANVLIENAVSLTGFLGNLFLGFMLSFYLLSGKENIIKGLKNFTIAVFGDKGSVYLIKVAVLVNKIFEQFISGQLVEMVILASIFYIGLSLFNMPYALLISILTGISGIIPIIGAMMAMIFGSILILGSKSLEWVIGFIALFQVLQQFENNFVYPKVVGESVGLPGIFVLLSIIIFGDLFGAVGMIIAVPSMAVIYALVSEFVLNRINK